MTDHNKRGFPNRRNLRSRRALIKSAFATLGVLSLPYPATMAATKGPRVIVVGGGFAGATCARFLRKFAPSLQVTLIESRSIYSACPFSNLVIAGHRDMQRQMFSYQALREDGIQVLNDTVTEVNAAHRQVVTQQGNKFTYDRLVMAPGIAMRWNDIEGYNEQASVVMPHAWKAGLQTTLLRDQLQAMPDGGVVVMAVPETPYRCPPGPYERASLIAGYLQKRKPKSKLLILDSKDSFSKKPLFMQGWKTLYGDLIEWQGLSDGAAITGVDVKGLKVRTNFEEVQAAVANIIPPQKAATIAEKAGLTDSSGWCPIHPATFESARQPNIHVLGDAAIANAMPKSAFSANAQAKLCALQISHLLQGNPPVTGKLINTCYSLVAPNYGISVSDVFEPGAKRWNTIKGAGGTSPVGAADSVRKQEAEYANSWFNVITNEVFG